MSDHVAVPSNTSRRIVLVVDDEQPLLRALVQELERKNYTVFSATDGEAGLELAKEKRPDLVLLDILMPKKHGFDVLRDIRSQKWGKTMPVILLSNLVDEPRAVEATKTDPNCLFITKSDIKIADLISKVGELTK